MSTILDALRKAKQVPAQETVEPGRELLSERTHNYLAASGSSSDEVRFLKTLVWTTGGVIVLLIGVLVFLLFAVLGPDGERVRAVSTSPSDQTGSSLASAAPVSTVEIVVSTPAPVPSLVKSESEVIPPAEPTPGPTPSATPDPALVRMAAYREISGLKISGIYWDSEAPVALIDGRTVSEGAELGSARVTAVNRDSVEITVRGEVFTLRP
ncbi:hypothetical protein HQ520_09230 [bacterium]|nr:hypothetical protein [bacterium]